MIGESVAQYRIVKRLGAGGMGVVYEAEDTRLHRTVALKFLGPGAGDAAARERFVREARASAALNHPHICTIHEIGEHDGRPFLAMELLEGRPLSEAIADGPVSAERWTEWAMQLADALREAHAAGLIHRDIKPANIFVTRRDQLKILDFGLAKKVEPSAGGGATVAETIAAGLTQTAPGTTLGTVAYMSPEQVRGEPLDGRSDLFSLGLVLYEMAAGRPAFPGRTSGVIFDGILNRSPEPPGSIGPAFPASLERILMRLLEKDPDRRYGDAAELLGDLERARSGEDVVTAHASPAAAAPSPAAATPPAGPGPPSTATAALPRTLGVRYGMSPVAWAAYLTITSMALGTALATIAAVVIKGPEASDAQRRLAWISSVVVVVSGTLALVLRGRIRRRAEASSGSVRVVKLERDPRAESQQRNVRRGLLWGTIVFMMGATARSLLKLTGGFDRGDLVAAAMTGSFGAYLLYKELKSRDRSGDWWEKGCAHRTIEIEAAETDIASRCEKALLELGARVTVLDPEAGLLEAQTGPGWRSWGERMRVQIREAGPGRFRVEVWSENAANVRKILDTLLT